MYTIDYFIRKLDGVSSSLWTDSAKNEWPRRDLFQILDCKPNEMSVEGLAFLELAGGANPDPYIKFMILGQINDGEGVWQKLGPEPKDRVLNYLKLLKKKKEGR